MSELFDEPQSGDVDLQNNDINGKGHIFINSGVTNQGIKGYTDRPARVFPGNTITIDFFGNAYYRPFPYKMATHNHVFSFSGSTIQDESVGLYLVAAMSYLPMIYSYGNMATKKSLKKNCITIPFREGKIDFAFMRRYIATLKAERVATLKAYLQAAGLSDTSYMSNDEANVIELPQAAEPFEVYGWGDISEKIPASSETILIGCYRDKRHLDWILATHLYNIRSGRRKGSSDAWHKCFGEAKTLYLYDSNNLSKVYTFRISGNKEMSGKELAELNYPRKSPGKSYMTFSLVKIENPVADIQPIDIQEVLDSISDHIKGTPVFIEAEK